MSDEWVVTLVMTFRLPVADAGDVTAVARAAVMGGVRAERESVYAERTDGSGSASRGWTRGAFRGATQHDRACDHETP
jgi:hypothetical protein